MPDSSLTPLLSIVVPVYNGQKFIAACLSSIQTSLENLTAEQLQTVEIIVCDNQSSDETLAIAQGWAFPCPYRVVQTPEHFENRTRNWHHGLSLALGTWMMMMHADDLFSQGGIGSLLDACAHPKARRAVLITGQYRTFTDETQPGALSPKWNFPSLIPGQQVLRNVLYLMCPFVPFTTMRRATYEKVGGLDSKYELVQDWDLWVRILGEGALLCWPKETGLWRIHGFSPYYANVFSEEHIQVAVDIKRIMPHLSKERAAESLECMKSKATIWQSQSETDRILAGHGLPGDTEFDAEAIHERYRKAAKIRFIKLRALGTINYLVEK